MPPLDPTDPAPLLGRTAAELLFGNDSWVHRRKETVTILDATWFRRQISIDYELPDTLASHRSGPNQEPLYAVPITLMRKSPPAYVDFDMKDQSGASVSLMTRAQNAAVSLAALKWAAHKAAFASNEGKQLNDALADLVKTIAEGDPLAAGVAVHDLQLRCDATDKLLLADDQFMWLALAFAEHSVVMVEVAAGDGRRRMIKLAYNERNLDRSAKVPDRSRRGARGGLEPYPVFIDSPFIAAGTYHFELVPPPGLEVVDTTMDEYFYLDALADIATRAPYERPAADPVHEKMAFLVRSGTRTHMYVADAGVTDRAEVSVRLRVQREGFVSTATWISTAIAALLVCFLVALRPVIEHEGVVPSVLLLTPGITAAMVGRAGEHRLTIRMLNLVRRALVLSAGCVLVAAVGLALSRTGDDHAPTTLLWIVWTVVTASALYSALLLQIARRLPKREGTKWDRWLVHVVRPLAFLLDASFLRVRWRTLPQRTWGSIRRRLRRPRSTLGASS